MRQDFKDKEFLDEYIKTNVELVEIGLIKLRENRVNPEMLDWYKKSLFDKLLLICIAEYTRNNTLFAVRNGLITSINQLESAWIINVVKFEYKGKLLNQYTAWTYDQMLWMLSLGYLLDISNNDFKKLVDVIDRDGVRDYLFEFIIRAKLPDREQITEESYEYGWALFGKLRQAITETEKSKAEKLVKEFITKDWYKEHKDTGWYNSHKNKHNTYFGYWSFETAAVVKIMGLDDSTFRDCPYYPKDLVS